METAVPWDRAVRTERDSSNSVFAANMINITIQILSSAL